MPDRLETRLSLRPGEPGTRKLLARFGERLVRVRYRYDAERKRRLKTVELIVEDMPWTPSVRKLRRTPDDIVAVRLHWSESQLRSRAMALGAIWRPGPKLWEMTWDTARKLGLSDRVQGSLAHQRAAAASLEK